MKTPVLTHRPSPGRADTRQYAAVGAERIDAQELVRGLVGKTVFTVGLQKPNKVIAIRGADVIVGTAKSPGGEPVPIQWVQDAIDQLFARGELLIDVKTVGYRSAFIGAVLATIPGVIMETRPRRARLVSRNP